MSILSSINTFFGLNDDEYDDYDDYSPEMPTQQTRVPVEEPPRTTKATRTPQPQGKVPYRASQQRTQQSAPPPQTQTRVTNNQYASMERPTAQSMKQPVREERVEKVVSIASKQPQQAPQLSRVKIAIKDPRVYSESKEIGTLILGGEAVLVNFHLMEEVAARRVIDFLTGIVYAVEGDIQRVGNEIFLCTPHDMEIDGETTRSLLHDQNFDF